MGYNLLAFTSIASANALVGPGAPDVKGVRRLGRLVKTFATFRAEMPDDTTYGADGAPDTPGGRNVAELLLVGLRTAGRKVSGQPYQHDDYGWAFDVDAGTVTIWCMLQYPGPWLLITEQHERRFRDWLLRRRFDHVHQEVLADIEQIVNASPVLSDLKWYTRKEYETSGE